MNDQLVSVRRYEIGRGGEMIPIDENAGAGLPVGTVVHWGGNMGWAERDFCILDVQTTEFGGFYLCFDMEEREKNAALLSVEFASVKRPDDPKIWHGQHFFITEKTCTLEQMAEFTQEHKRQAEAAKSAEDASKAKFDALTEEGKKLWAELGFEGAQHLIVAEWERDTSDAQTDYFGSVTEQTVILARSEHGRDMFSELRKAAAKLPETACYGPGKGVFHPYIKLDTDIPDDNGRAYWKGGCSHWHHELDEPNGTRLTFSTRQEVEAFIAASPRPKNISFDGVIASFSWAIREEEIEHREKYSGGHGYYLGLNRHSGWHVRKIGVGNNPPFAMLAARHNHLSVTEAKPKPARGHDAAQEANPEAQQGATLTANREKGGLELRFPRKPPEAALDALKAAGWRWSRFGGCWWIKASEAAYTLAQGFTQKGGAL